ncbi:hypothetical protein [Clostridium scatologenes]|uniref:Phage protein n=1 Tax=Clostridium scatologenes TaxID=1548 RepID=A0A0E3M7A9_CLOSL|nr:hypothetical protein [Clostridium scatologenes]AKA70134.1 hypothetical protein CSCA_3009 [Clostridium scatologenes]
MEIDTHYRRTYDYLKENNIDVYSIGQKTGECKKEYVVIKENGTSGNEYIGYGLIDIIIFFPINRFSEMELYVKQIRKLLKDLKFLQFTGNITPGIVDTDVKGYTTSIQYQIFKKID